MATIAATCLKSTSLGSIPALEMNRFDFGHANYCRSEDVKGCLAGSKRWVGKVGLRMSKECEVDLGMSKEV